MYSFTEQKSMYKPIRAAVIYAAKTPKLRDHPNRGRGAGDAGNKSVAGRSHHPGTNRRDFKRNYNIFLHNFSPNFEWCELNHKLCDRMKCDRTRKSLPFLCISPYLSDSHDGGVVPTVPESLLNDWRWRAASQKARFPDVGMENSTRRRFKFAPKNR